MPQVKSVRKPVTIISGFDGPGKHKLLQKILHGNHGLRVAVVVQDPEAVGVSEESFQDTLGLPVTVPNCCICCRITLGLGTALEQLSLLLGNFEHLVVETAALGNSVPPAHHFLGGPAADSFRLANLLVLVDAGNSTSQLGQKHGLWGGQVRAADQVIITNAEGGDTAELKTLIGQLNPLAIVREADPGKISVKSVLRRDPLTALRSHSPGTQAHPRFASLTELYTSVTLKADGLLDATAVNQWLGNLLCTVGDKIDRFKGVLSLAGQDHLILVHGVREQCEAIRLIERSPRPDDPYSKLVLVGAKDALNPGELRAGFAACVVGAQAHAQPTVAIKPRPLLPANQVRWPERHIPAAIADRYGPCPSCLLCIPLDETIAALDQAVHKYARELRRLELAAVRAGKRLDDLFESILAEQTAFVTQLHAFAAALYLERAVLVNLYLDDNKYGLRDANRLRVGVMAHDVAADSYWIWAQELAAELRARFQCLKAAHAALTRQPCLRTLLEDAPCIIGEGLTPVTSFLGQLPDQLEAYAKQVEKWLSKKRLFVTHVLQLD